MKQYIGLDAHSSSSTFSVVTAEGKEIDNVTIETNGRFLVRYLKGLSGEKVLTFEESELSFWLSAILRKEVDKLVVCNPVANKEYKGKKTDKLDARKLARLLRGGFLTGVYHDGTDREKFRHLMSGYQDVVKQGVGLKNRYKSLFRKGGKRIKGETIYNDESLLKDLGNPDFKFMGAQIYQLLKETEKIRQAYVKEIKKYIRKFKEAKYIKTLPGIGSIQTAKIISQVINPYRFKNKYKYYSYCGLVRHQKISGEKKYGSEKIWGNRTLKGVYKMAAHSALRGNSALRAYYDCLRLKGTGDKNARNAVSRKIAAISLSLWKKNKSYNDNLLKEQIKHSLRLSNKGAGLKI